MKTSKKILAVVLSVMLLISVMPFAAFAADVDSYQSLVDEVAAFNAGDADVTITLTADVELQGTITIDTANGKTLTINGGKNITLASGVGSAFYVKQGSLNLGKNTITGAPSNYKLIYLTGSTNPQDANYSNVTIAGATINCTNGYAVMISANGNAAYGANITTKSGTVYGYYGALYVNGSVKANAGNNIANVKVSGGTLKSTEDEGTAIYGAGYANYTITSGTLTAASAAYFKAGNVTISGGTFNGTGADKAYEPSGNGYEPTGEAVVLESNSGYAPVTSVSIKGGTFNSANADPIGTYANDTSVTAPDNFITGGRFKSAGAAADVSEYFADVAEVNGVKYKSFEDALAAISNVSTAKHSKAVDPNYDYKTYVANGTIKLLADTTSNGIIIGSGSNLVVDFNGKTLDINEKPVGSNGTESIALQLLKNSDITFTNGTLTSSYTYSKTDTEYIQRLIQNYSNLTLDNMNVTMTGNFKKAITISTCNGDFVVKDSTVSAPDFSAYGYTTAMAAEQLGAEAFAFGTFSGYTAATATVQGYSTINGNVSVGVTNPDVSTNTLTLTGGTLNGDIVMKDNANSEGVEITKANTFTQKAPEGYKWVDNGDGTSTIAVVDASNGSSLTLTDGVKFNAYVDADAYGVDVNEAVVKLTYNHNADVSKTKAVSTDTIALTDATKYVKAGDPYDGTYKFAFAVAPAQYAEDITIELYATADAETPLFTTTTNVKTMCEKVIALAETESAYAAYANLCKALADYCQAAQVFFNYDAPATPAYYNDAVTTLAAADMEVPTAFVGIEAAGFSFTIVSALEVNVFYNGDLEIQNVSINSTKGADAVKAETTTKGGKNCINITGIASGNLDNVITVNTSAGVVELSATNIAKAIAGSADTNYANLARALYLYSVQASAFFGA